MGDADADPAFLAADVINTTRNRLAQRLLGKIMQVDLLLLAFGLPFLSPVLEPADQLFLLGVD